METIISSCITAAVAISICAINNYNQNKLSEKQQDKTRELMEYKLDELTKRVDKHNNLVEKTYMLEKTLSLQEEKLKAIDHRIESLEKGEHE